MPAGTPFGLFDAATNQLLWVFPSLLAAAKCCGFKQPPAALKNGVKDDGKYIQGKYGVGAITKDEVDAFPMDKSRTDEVAEIVKTNADWTIAAVTETVKTCTQCGESKPATAEYFRVENDKVLNTCRDCRRDAVAQNAANKAAAVSKRIEDGHVTFRCTGNGVDPAHNAPLDQHLGDRDMCRDCYNAKHQADYQRIAEPGAIAKLREQLAGQFAECTKCGETKDTGREFAMRVGSAKGHRPWCQACVNGLQTWKTFRKRKRALDEAAFLAHNAAVLRKWRERNPHSDERWRTKRRQDAKTKMQQTVLPRATKYGIPVNMDDLDTMADKLEMPCTYCDFKDPEGDLNGLDRVNNDHGYSDANTVPACTICNLIKHTLSFDDFVAMVNAIAENNEDIPAATALPKTNFCGVAEHSAKSKDMALAIVHKQRFNSADDVCCYLCGLSKDKLGEIGVDRINSDLDYLDDNVMPCCSRCNYAKKDMDLTEFLGHIHRMVIHLAAIDIDVDAINQVCASEVNNMEVPMPKTTKRKTPTHHVSHARATGITITNSSGAIVAVFPTIAAASKALGYANLSDQLAKSNNTIHGWHFTKVSAAQLPDMDRAAQKKFITDFMEIKGGIGKPKTRRHLRLRKDGDTHEFPSKSAAAEFLGVSEAGIRFGLKNSGVVRGYEIEEFDG